MSLQVASLSIQNMGVPVKQELPVEKRMPFLGEQRAAAEEEPVLPDSRKSEAPEIKQTASDLERISLAFDRRLKFIIDQESREILIKVIDNETDKVIKVLPPEELQKLHHRIRETVGFLFDTLV